MTKTSVKLEKIKNTRTITIIDNGNVSHLFVFNGPMDYYAIEDVIYFISDNKAISNSEIKISFDSIEDKLGQTSASDYLKELIHTGFFDFDNTAMIGDEADLKIIDADSSTGTIISLIKGIIQRLENAEALLAEIRDLNLPPV